MKAVVGEWEILTKITEKEEAKQTYSDAVASGNIAVKVSYDEEVADILSIHIGQLPPHKSASVEVVMVSMLSAISAPGSLKGYFNFTFPRAFFPASRGTERGQGTFGAQIRLSQSSKVEEAVSSLKFDLTETSPDSLTHIFTLD